jgi:beta-galactosidase/beta-glucuronidase
VTARAGRRYPSPAQLASLAQLRAQNARSLQLGRRWPAGRARSVRPVIMCEYAHAMGNSLGNFDEFWATIRAHDCLQVPGRSQSPQETGTAEPL